jgi:hypothetical protein
MKRVYLPLLSFLVANISTAQATSKFIHVFDNKLTMSVPWDVDAMTAEQVRYKYQKPPDKKSFYYANKDLSFSIALISVADSVTESEMLANKDGIIDGIASNGFKVEEYEIKKINNHTLIIVAFYSDPSGGRVLNKRFYGVLNNKMIMVSFNCAADELIKRKYQIEESINSVQMKD